MKKTIEKEVEFCDACEAEGYTTACLCCGKEFCYDCRKTNGVEYSHSVHCQGSGDGFYCTECDSKLKKSGADKLHRAYLKIQDLRAEEKRFWEEFKKKADLAEAEVQTLFKAGGF